MKTECPHCKHVNKAPDEYIGRKAKCAKCREVFVLAKIVERALEPPDISVKVGKEDIQKPKDNFLVKMWTRSPVPFRTAFLATLGVIAALWASWYIFGVARYFTTPTKEGRGNVVSMPKKEIIRPVKTEMNIPRYDATDRDLAYLACAIRINAYMEGLYQLQNIRVIASKEFGLNANRVHYTAALTVCQRCLSQIRVRIASINLLQDKELVLAREYMIEAIDAELEFTKSLTNFVGYRNPNSHVEAIKAQGERVSDSFNRAMMQSIMVATKYDEGLLKALTNAEPSGG